MSPDSARAEVTADTRINLVGLSREQLAQTFAELDQKPFRAKQVWHWIYHRGATDFAAMTELSKDLRATLDEHSDKLGAKIRRAEIDKVPYTLVIGQKEAETNSVSVRSRARGDEGVMTADDYVTRLKAEVASRSLPNKKTA